MANDKEIRKKIDNFKEELSLFHQVLNFKSYVLKS